MKNDKKLELLPSIVKGAKHLVIIQADNPDGDSLSSALALEEILEEQGKKVSLYCGVDIPSYLQYLPGWDRVSKDLPANFDASILVDVSNEILLEQLDETKQKGYIKTKPSYIIDHHTTKSDLSWASGGYCETSVSTTELIFEICQKLNWKLNLNASELLAVGLLSDSLGLTTESTTARSLRVLADLVDNGVSLAKLENARRQTMTRAPELVHFKGSLLQRIEYHHDNQVATLIIPWEENEKYSPLYNPSMLAIDDMRLTANTKVAICFKIYPDGKITGKIRCNFGYPIGNKLAEHFGGGGHPYASGFKVTGKKLDDIKNEVIEKSLELLNGIGDETL